MRIDRQTGLQETDGDYCDGEYDSSVQCGYYYSPTVTYKDIKPALYDKDNR